MLGDDLAFLEISEDSPMQNKFSDTQIIIKKKINYLEIQQIIN